MTTEQEKKDGMEAWRAVKEVCNAPRDDGTSLQRSRRYFQESICQFKDREKNICLLLSSGSCDGLNGKFHCPLWAAILAKIDYDD